MSVLEFSIFFASALLIALILGQGVSAYIIKKSVREGLIWQAGNREEELSNTAFWGRFKRTVSNHTEGMVIYVPIALLAILMNKSGLMIEIGAYTYMITRVIYIFCYLLGIKVIRSYAWIASMLGTILVMISLFV